MKLQEQPETISHRIGRIVRGAGLILPMLFVVYTLLVQRDVVANNTQLVSDNNALVLCILWLVIGSFQIMKPSTTRFGSLVRLIANHLIAASFLLLVVGFSSPLVYTWSIMIVATYVYFGSIGMGASIGLLAVLAVVDFYLNAHTANLATTNLFATLTTAMIGGLSVGSMQGGIIDQQDVDRSHAEESFQRDRMITLVNNLADAVLSTDGEGRIRVYNAAALNLLDTNTELEGQLVDEVLRLHTIDNKRFSLLSSLHESTTVITHDDIVAILSGEAVRLEVTASPIRGSYSDSQQVDSGYIIILRDITSAKSLEEERDEFISVVSHELRTPITVAEGTISNVQLMMQRDDTPEDKLIKAVDLAHEQIVFLARMVNDLSTLSRAERGVADEPESIDLETMIRDLYNEYHPQAKDKGLEFNLNISSRPGTVLASHLYLKELLQNFVTNAIKYTKEGTVSIETHHNKTSDEVTISVRDSGIGISKSDLTRIFEKFYRSEDYRTRETGGTGLGLYVAEKLAKKIGTSIDIKSRLNYGSTFSITLPLEPNKQSNS